MNAALDAGAPLAARVSRRAAAAWLVAAALVPAAGARAALPPLPAARDLQREIAAAAAGHEPLVVMVTLVGCAWCDVVRRHHLMPLHAAGRPVARIDMRSRATLRGPDGRTLREAELAGSWGVRMAPTLLFLGPGGAELAPRLAGYGEDFYGGYLDDALARSRARLATARG